MPEQDADAGELNEGEEVLRMVFPAGDEAPVVLKPGEATFHLPAASRASQSTAILGLLVPVTPVGGDHLDAAPGKSGVESVAVVGHIPDEVLGQVGDEA